MAKITIFGLAGTGTSTVGKLLAERLNYNFISTGNLFRAKAAALGLDLYQFEKLCNSNERVDKDFDQEIAKYGKQHDNFVMDSRLAWYFIPDSIKIKFECDFDTRIKRVAMRDNISFDSAKEKTVIREADSKKRYQDYYGIADLSDDKHFDFLIDTTSLAPEQITEEIIAYLKGQQILL